jgi:hypothetical protein
MIEPSMESPVAFDGTGWLVALPSREQMRRADPHQAGRERSRHSCQSWARRREGKATSLSIDLLFDCLKAYLELLSPDPRLKSFSDIYLSLMANEERAGTGLSANSVGFSRSYARPPLVVGVCT